MVVLFKLLFLPSIVNFLLYPTGRTNSERLLISAVPIKMARRPSSDDQANTDDQANKVLACTQRLLNAIVNGDYGTYNDLCSDDMTCIEPECNKQVVVGKAFHKYYFDLFGKSTTPVNVTMSQPRVQFMGDNHKVAVVTYIRLNQMVQDDDGKPVTTQTSETRVWEQQSNGKWLNRHCHKS
jgi:calcium/calmodulin-dependent protein kinase (CaM kinase) II